MVAVLYRPNKKSPWEFITYCADRDVGDRSCRATIEQERDALGRKQAQVMMVWRSDFDAGKLKPLRVY